MINWVYDGSIYSLFFHTKLNSTKVSSYFIELKLLWITNAVPVKVNHYIWYTSESDKPCNSNPLICKSEPFMIFDPISLIFLSNFPRFTMKIFKENWNLFRKPLIPNQVTQNIQKIHGNYRVFRNYQILKGRYFPFLFVVPITLFVGQKSSLI